MKSIDNMYRNKRGTAYYILFFRGWGSNQKNRYIIAGRYTATKIINFILLFTLY